MPHRLTLHGFALPPPADASAANVSLLAWGSNVDAQCGLGDGARAPRVAERPSSVAFLAGQRLRAVACGGAHSLALTARGRLYAWGAGDAGALGVGAEARAGPSALPQLVAGLAARRLVWVGAGDGFSLALDDGGELHGWGANQVGQLGLGDARWRAEPARILGGVGVAAAGAAHALALRRDDGALVGWGRNRNGQLGLGAPTVQRAAGPRVQRS